MVTAVLLSRSCHGLILFIVIFKDKEKPNANPRWFVDQLYVNEVKGELPPGIKKNAKGGCTLSTRKYGGWGETFKLAKDIAGWTKGPEST